MAPDLDRPGRFSATRDFGSDTIDIRMALYGRDGEMHVACPVVFERCRAGDAVNPFVRLSPESASRLMDELWRAGVRPTEAMGSVGQLEAVNRHLEDMRTLVFKGAKK